MRHAGMEFVADQTRQFQNRAPFCGGAQIGLVGQPLLVEGQHIAGRCPGVDEGDGKVIVLASAQAGERGIGGRSQVRQHGRLETRVVADPRVHLVGYGPSASTVGANRAGRAAVREIRELLEPALV